MWKILRNLTQGEELFARAFCSTEKYAENYIPRLFVLWSNESLHGQFLFYTCEGEDKDHLVHFNWPTFIRHSPPTRITTSKLGFRSCTIVEIIVQFTWASYFHFDWYAYHKQLSWELGTMDDIRIQIWTICNYAHLIMTYVLRRNPLEKPHPKTQTTLRKNNMSICKFAQFKVSSTQFDFGSAQFSCHMIEVTKRAPQASIYLPATC